MGKLCCCIIAVWLCFAGLYPLAFAIVNEETDDHWNYFFLNLSCAIGGSRNIVYISDRTHWILEGVKIAFADSPHAYCYNHLKSNLEYRWRGMGMKNREVVLKLGVKMDRFGSIFGENRA